MSEVRRLDPDAWEARGEIVPRGEAEDAGPWIARAEARGWRWEIQEGLPNPGSLPGSDSGSASDTTSAGDSSSGATGYTFVLAVSPPASDAPISYYLLRVPDSEELGLRAGRVTARGLSALGQTFGRFLGPLAGRWQTAWEDLQEQFVGLDEVAKLAQASHRQVESWRREHPSFPPSVLDREGKPLFLKDEVLAWLDETGKPEEGAGTEPRSRLHPEGPAQTDESQSG